MLIKLINPKTDDRGGRKHKFPVSELKRLPQIMIIIINGYCDFVNMNSEWMKCTDFLEGTRCQH